MCACGLAKMRVSSLQTSTPSDFYDCKSAVIQPAADFKLEAAGFLCLLGILGVGQKPWVSRNQLHFCSLCVWYLLGIKNLGASPHLKMGNRDTMRI